MAFYLLYTSTPTVPMTQQLLDELTETCIRNNKITNVTGMLLGIQNRYMQYLEGDEDEVNRLFQAIKKDPRHKDVVAWITGYTKERIFREWSMGSWMLSKETLSQLGALSDLKAFLRNPENDPIQPKRFIVLMNGLLKTWITEEPEKAQLLRN